MAGNGGAWLTIGLGLALLVAHRPLAARMARREGDPGGNAYFLAIAGLGLVVTGTFYLLV